MVVGNLRAANDAKNQIAVLFVPEVNFAGEDLGAPDLGKHLETALQHTVVSIVRYFKNKYLLVSVVNKHESCSFVVQRIIILDLKIFRFFVLNLDAGLFHELPVLHSAEQYHPRIRENKKAVLFPSQIFNS